MSTIQSPRVRHFRQSLLWPLQLMPLRASSQIQDHWQVLQRGGGPWHETTDAFCMVDDQWSMRHYGEFVTFLPYVQRFLYGEPRPGGAAAGESKTADDGASPMRIFSRSDVKAARIVLRAGEPAHTLAVDHVDLYFFYDIDVVLLNVALYGEDLALEDVQEFLYRLGRAYPAGWAADGAALNCAHSAEWLDAQGNVLARSDAQERDRFLAFVSRQRAPRIAAHWAYLLQPLASDSSEDPGVIRFRQLEYYRMPVLAYLALDDPRSLTRDDFIRLGLITSAGADATLPFSERHTASFERDYCYDRFWSEDPRGPSTRYIACGHALVVVGDARAAVFTDGETGALAQFRHQHFLLFLIAHFQKASLVMLSDRLVDALRRLEIENPESVKRFKRAIRQQFEIFLRFTHRYWFHEIADQAQAKALFHLTSTHLGLDRLYAEVKEEIHDMDEYLNTDSLRRQANTVVRLTVVTTFGLIGTVATGFLGMNLLAAAESPLLERIILFAVTLAATIFLTLYTLAKSRRLADFLGALSDERLTLRSKLGSLARVWRSTSKN